MDANILIAAFLRASTARRILTLTTAEFLAPEFLHEEILRHLPGLGRRAGLSRRDAMRLLDLLEGYLIVLPAEKLLPFWDQAAAAMDPIDPRDTAYVAAALGAPCDGIWSDDRHLKAQRVVPCWTTRELVAALRNAGLEP